MKALVTGGAGFIGFNFIRYILNNNNNFEILNLDALKYGSDPANLKNFAENDRYSFVQGDISNYTLVSELIKGADAVCELCSRNPCRQEHLSSRGISAKQCEWCIHPS